MPKTILLADDSVTIQKVVGISFANEDVVLLTVDNGDEALNRARESRPDIVLADIVMPGMSGYEVCAALRADSELRNVPVLLLSGTFETFDEDRARDVGADGHITKPFEAQALVDQVNELLARATPDPLSLPDGNSHTTLLEPAQAPAYDFFDDEMAAPAAAPEATPVAETTLLASDPNDDSAVGQVFDLEPLDDSQSGADLGSTAHADEMDDPFGAIPLAEPVMATPAFTPAAETRVTPDAPVDANASFGSPIDHADESDAFGAAFETEEVLASSSAAFSFDEDAFGGALQSEPPAAAFAPSGDSGADLFHAGDSFQTPADAPNETPSAAAEADPEPFDGANFATQQVASQDEWGSPAPDADLMPRAADNAVADVQATDDAVQSPEPAFLSPPPVAEPAIEATAEADPSDALPVMPLALQERVHETLERVAWEAMGDLSERVVKEALNRIEAIAWEVIPQMAETLIREEIERMKDGDDS